MSRDIILVVDLGCSETQHLARSVRNAGVYCEIVSGDNVKGRAASGYICAGGGMMPEGILQMDAPVLALGDASGALLKAGGKSPGAYALQNQLTDVRYEKEPLFMNIEDGMRRIDRAFSADLPPGWKVIAAAAEAPLAFADPSGKFIGLQFLPERNDLDGYQILSNFVHLVCGCALDWNTKTFLNCAIEGIRNRVGDGVALCPMTGGVDSAVAATLAYRALGDRAICFFVDTGLIGEGQADKFERMFNEEIGIPIRRISAADRIMSRLSGVTDPAKKRTAVAEEFHRLTLEQKKNIDAERVFFVQGTIYNDILYPSGNYTPLMEPGENAVTLEPLRSLFKFEVRQLGEQLGLPEHIVQSQPYPGAGLAIRCMGEVTQRRIDMLKKADAIFRRAIAEANAEKGLSQYFAIMTDIKSLNSRGNREGAVIVLRAVTSRSVESSTPARLSYDLLENCVRDILRDVPGVERVLYDLSPKPPASVELE